MRKATKIVISFAVVLIAGLNFIVPAFAQDPFTAIAVGGLTGASGAGLFGSMAGMSGLNIGWSSAGSDPMDAMWNVTNPDHIYFSGEKHEADPQQDPEDVYDWITVDLGDWLDAQTDFISQFCTDYGITSNSQGTIATQKSYAGYPFIRSMSTPNAYAGYPLASNINLTIYPEPIQAVGAFSATYQIPYGSEVLVNIYNNNVRIKQWTFSRYQTYQGGSFFLAIDKNSNTFYLCIVDANGENLQYTWFDLDTPDPAQSINYSAGDLNTHVFDGWENARVKIPHNISGLSPNWTIPEFLGAINNLWTQNQQGQIVIEDTDQPVPPPPIPDTPLGDVPFDDWIDLWGQGIYQQLENQSDTLDLIGSNGIDAIEELESIDTNTEDLVEVAESIDTNIGVGNGILGGIRSLAQSAVNYLEGIAEHVGELVEEIVEGTETLIAGILNQIPQAFGVIFGPIKQASSIWHYVVEWITSIGAPFQFIWSMASGTSYYIILPVYASLAAAVVLAFFKRFGR